MWDTSAPEEPRAGALFGEKDSFHTKSLAQRAWIVSAGPLANFIFAFVAFWALAQNGRWEPATELAAPTVESVAGQVGLREGDRVAEVSGRSVQSFNEVRWQIFRQLIAAPSKPIPLTVVEASGTTRTVRLVFADPPEGFASPDQRMAALGISPRSFGVRVTGVQPDGPAARAGLTEGMVVLGASGQAVLRPQDLIALVRASEGAPVELLLVDTIAGSPGEERPASERRVTIRPVIGPSGQYIIGMGVGVQPRFIRQDASAMESVARAVTRTYEISLLSIQALYRMVTGELSWRQLNGPVAIAEAAGQSASMGWTAFLSFLALVSVSIGVLNLLPIPMLDGGHLLYYCVEFVRGRPLSDSIQQAGHKIGLAMVLGLTGLALFNDFTRFFGP
jgi:regulator of sigma E protease